MILLWGGTSSHVAHVDIAALWFMSTSLRGGLFQSTCIREHSPIKVSAHSSQSYVRGATQIENPKTSGSASTTSYCINPLIITNTSPVLTGQPTALWLRINGSDIEEQIVLLVVPLQWDIKVIVHRTLIRLCYLQTSRMEHKNRWKSNRIWFSEYFSLFH